MQFQRQNRIIKAADESATPNKQFFSNIKRFAEACISAGQGWNTILHEVEEDIYLFTLLDNYIEDNTDKVVDVGVWLTNKAKELEAALQANNFTEIQKNIVICRDYLLTLNEAIPTVQKGIAQAKLYYEEEPRSRFRRSMERVEDGFTSMMTGCKLGIELFKNYF